MDPDAPPTGRTSDGHSSSGPYGGRFAAEPPPQPSHSPGDAVREALGKIGEVKEFVSYYLAAKMDGIKVTVRNLVIYAILGVVGAIAGVAVIVMAVVLLVGSLANALGNLSGYLLGDGWAWIGPLLVSLIILGGLAAGVIIGLKKFSRTSHSKLVSKYEDRQRQQRVNYGFDVEQRAREQRAQEHGAAAR